VIQAKYWSRSYTLKGGIPLHLGQRTLIMGILNVTPDSFSDGGQFNSVNTALRHVESMIEAGVDIVDIGGESTRPGFTKISSDEECSRVLPIIKAISERYPHVVLSIDTYKASTARAALDAGAHIINDIWCLKGDDHMAEVAAEYDCPVILNHNRANVPYDVLIDDVVADLLESVELATTAGVKQEHIWLDPGIGFAKTYEENLNVHAQLTTINALGYPVLLGTSRKRFIREILQTEQVEDTLEGTIASNVLGITQGCQIVRVHNVHEMKKAALVADAILYRMTQYKE